MSNILTIAKHLSVNSSAAAKIFAGQYYLLRKKENRIYTDEELLRLPVIAATHPHYKEWQLRKKSCKRLLKYLNSKKAPLQILEVGCGNGWLSAQLASLPNVTVTGIDINTEELKQAQRVFGGFANLGFTEGELGKNILNDMHYDVIIFAASIQYFPSVKKIVQTALSHLTLMGEVHIMDSVFYKKNELLPASQRSRDYFSKLSFPQMTDYYFHHSTDTLQHFEYRTLYNPQSFFNRIRPGHTPFHHFIITGKK